MHLLVIATRNAHKTAEIQSILGPSFCCLSLTDFPGAPVAVEDADTFAGNAMKKARALAHWLQPKITRGQPWVPERLGDGLTPADWFVLADDSGLEVDAVHGAPGVHSARFAALEQAGVPSEPAPDANTPDAANNAKLMRLLAGLPSSQRTARFRCVLALVPIGDSSQAEAGELFEGTCEGRIGFEPQGRGGFGYDPLFVPTGYQQSFAELGDEVKNRLSHRARALEQLRSWFEQRSRAAPA